MTARRNAPQLAHAQRGFLLNPFRFGVPHDPDFANVGALLHCNGSNGSTTFTDSGPAARAFSAYGSAQISTAQSLYGGASGVFDGDGDYLITPSDAAWNFGSGLFTLEIALRPSSSSVSVSRFILVRDQIGGTRGWLLYAEVSTGRLSFGAWQGGTLVSISAPGNFMSSRLNQWSRVGVRRTPADNLEMWIEGALVASAAMAGMTIGAPATPLCVGTGWLTSGAAAGAGSGWQGYMDELRITKGASRDLSVVATAPFPDA